jgi:hypothetical protein
LEKIKSSVFSLAILPSLYVASKYEDFSLKPLQYFVKQVTLFYQDIVDKILVPFEAH